MFLRGEVQHRETVISSLQETVRAREAELITMRELADGLQDSGNAGDMGDTGDTGDAGDAEVHHMPRRILGENSGAVAGSRSSEAAWLDVPGAGDLWADGSHPTVIDLQLVDLSRVLPNYEADRAVS